MKMNYKWLLVSMSVLLTACATGPVTVPITVQSDPLGSHVIYKLPSTAEGASGDWVYLGKTPIDLRQVVDGDELKKAQAFRVKVFKDGYNDQVRDWSEGEIEEAIEEKGHIFWNPKLVPNGS